jgi:hypothetical protein
MLQRCSHSPNEAADQGCELEACRGELLCGRQAAGLAPGADQVEKPMANGCGACVVNNIENLEGCEAEGLLEKNGPSSGSASADLARVLWG